MAETFPKNSLSELQIKGYEMALDDLSVHELEMGCRRVLRTWNFTVMPPPAFIRESVAAMVEEERTAERTANWLNPQGQPPGPRLTIEEAWDECEQVSRMLAAMREKINRIQVQKKAELKKAYRPPELVIARPERLAELEKQKKEVLGKYGKGTTVRVRDSASPKGQQGTSGEK